MSPRDGARERGRPAGVDLKALAAGGVTLVLWASAFAGIRAALEAYGPGHLVLFRFLCSSAALIPYALATRMQMPRWRDLPALLAMGLLGITVYHLLLTFGERTVTAGAACMLVSSAPIFTALFAVAYLKERPGRRAWAGIFISFAGVALVLLGEGKPLELEPGALLILLAAVSTSAFFVIQKRLLDRYGALQLATFAMWGGTLFLVPAFAPGLVATVRAAPLSSTLAVVYLGVLPGALAYGTWAYMLSRVEASVAGSYLYLSPVLAVLIAWVWLGEVPSWLSLGGGAVVVAGLVLASARKPRAGQGGQSGGHESENSKSSQ